MKKSKELRIVKELTNITDESKIALNEVGWTSRVYIVNEGEVVLKFLKSEQYREELQHEIAVMKLINQYMFNIDIPSISSLGEDSTYIVFNGVKGESMTAELVNELTKEQKREIGTQIGLFLKTLHAINFKGESPNNENDLHEWFQESFQKRKRTLKKYFNEKEFISLEELITTLPQKAQQYGIEEVFCHGDLGYNNILLTDNLEVGVIDFGDAGYIDKSYDFVGLEDDDMLDAAIIAYGGDDTLRVKVEVRRQLLPLMEMLFLIDKKDKEGLEQSAEKMRMNLKDKERV